MTYTTLIFNIVLAVMIRTASPEMMALLENYVNSQKPEMDYFVSLQQCSDCSNCARTGSLRQ